MEEVSVVDGEARSQVLTVAHEVCQAVMAGTVKLEELYERWPTQASDDPLLRAVFGDLEEAVEHAPGRLYRRGIDRQRWRMSEEYKRVFLDTDLIRRLMLGGSPDQLAETRSALLHQGIHQLGESDILDRLQLEG